MQPLAALASLLVATGCADTSVPSAGQVENSLTGASVFNEAIRHNTGAFPEVMEVNVGCTGSIVGPYAVVTAAHCEDEDTGSVSIGWGGSSLQLNGGYALKSAYTDASWNTGPDDDFFPKWWLDLGPVLGGPSPDFPAMHDLTVVFVPGLTEDFLRDQLTDYDMRAVTVDAMANHDRLTHVGTQGPPGAAREFAPQSFKRSTPNSISGRGTCPGTRDGFYLADGTVMADPGDSGGPIVGSSSYSFDGFSIDGPRHLVGVTSNGCSYAPASYEGGIPLTANQRATIRRNHLWLKAAISDVDQDFLPSACDSNPGSRFGSQNRCPAPIGGPTTFTNIPRADLSCKEGYLATGIRGKDGWLIDQLAVHCTPRSCLDRYDLSCHDDYWTDHFGGEGVGANDFSYRCPDGAVAAGINGRHDSGTLLRELSLYCQPLDNVRQSSYGSWSVSPAFGNVRGNLSYGSSYTRFCAAGEAMLGFEARSDDSPPGNDSVRWLTGLQPICTPRPGDSPTYRGGTGGEPYGLRCPGGAVAVGTVQNVGTTTQKVQMFGLLCMSRDRVVQGQPVASTELSVVHGRFSSSSSNVYPALLEDYERFVVRQPLNTVERRCSAGTALDAIATYGTNFINQLDYIHCEPVSGHGAPSWHHLNVGKAQGAWQTQYCGQDTHAVGALIQSHWRVDGIGLTCAP